jgi:hypothetical protein
MKNHQMRDILVTPDNARRREMFRPAHIDGMGSFRKRCRRRRPVSTSVDGGGRLDQTAVEKREK